MGISNEEAQHFFPVVTMKNTSHFLISPLPYDIFEDQTCKTASLLYVWEMAMRKYQNSLVHEWALLWEKKVVARSIFPNHVLWSPRSNPYHIYTKAILPESTTQTFERTSAKNNGRRNVRDVSAQHGVSSWMEFHILSRFGRWSGHAAREKWGFHSHFLVRS